MIWAEKLLDVVLIGFELAKCEHDDFVNFPGPGCEIRGMRATGQCCGCGAWRAPSGAWMQPSRVRELTRALEGQETVFRLGIMQVAGKVSSIVDAFKKRNEKSA